ncbi:UDP-Gal betaGal beta 1,3-galactosyltransferase, polypeptide 6 [Bulinus truncatus]|nr:UDP-Gal betaGal beta 1,3-galactosyltransferase, polypeptide 6 [Bulinus truncatus]
MSKVVLFLIVITSFIMLISRKLLYITRNTKLIILSFLILITLLYFTIYNSPCDSEVVLNGKYIRDYKSQHVRNNLLISSGKNTKASLLILIISGPDNKHEREAVRETWLKDISQFNIISKFVIGFASLDPEAKEEIRMEDSVYKDLIFLDNVKDSYQELTNKVLQAFIWAYENVDFQYLLKVDDDSYVTVSNLLSELQKKPKEKLYWGFFDGRANVKTSGKWKESSWFLCDKYLPYARGGGYVLSADLVHFITFNHHLLQHYLSEDVSVGTWLAPLKINRHHDQRFDTEYISRGCMNTYLIMHKQPLTKLHELHNNLMTDGKLCKNEYILRASYEYNWSYPPSKCCIREDRTR